MKEQEISDYFKMRTLSDVVLDQSAEKAAFTSSKTFKEYKKMQESDVIIVSTKDGSVKAIYRDDSRNFSPKFNRDGGKVAYISKTSKHNFLVISDLLNNRQEKILIEGTLEDFGWKDDNSLILLIVDKESSEEKKKKEEGDDGYYFEENHKFASLWLYVLGSGLSKITNGIQVWEFSINNDKIAAVTSELPYNWSWYEAQISLIDAKTGKIEHIYKPNKRQVAAPALSLKGSKMAFIESLWSDRGVQSGDIIVIDLNSREITNITESHEKSYSWFVWNEDDCMYTLSFDEGEYELSHFDGKEFKTIWRKEGSVHPTYSSSSSYANGKFALCFSDSYSPQEIVLIDQRSGEERTITSVNSELKNLEIHPVHKVKWKSKDGLEIYGFYRSAGKGKPMVVVAHGGPTSANTDTFMDHSSLIAAQGFSVFMPNFRGSIGKGRKYAEMNRGDMGGMDFEDILSGVEYMISQGIAEKGKIHITGGSYGGFMAAWAATQTDIFSSSVALFGITDWLSFHGVSSLAIWDRIHYDEDPYKFDKFVKFSPLRYVDNVKTPLLLMHGKEDPFVPIGQFYQFYRVLQEKGKKVRFVVFPREGHGFREKKHVEMYHREMMEWFRSHS